MSKKFFDFTESGANSADVILFARVPDGQIFRSTIGDLMGSEAEEVSGVLSDRLIETGQSLQDQIDVLEASGGGSPFDPDGLATSGYVEDTSGVLSNEILSTGQNLQEQLDSLELTGGGGGVGNVISVNGETGIVVISDVNLEYSGVHRSSFVSGDASNPENSFTLEFETGVAYYRINITGDQFFSISSDITSIPVDEVRGITIRAEADSSGPYSYSFVGLSENSFLNGAPTGINAGEVGLFSFNAFGPFSENVEAVYADSEVIPPIVILSGENPFDPSGLATTGYVGDVSGALSNEILNSGQFLLTDILNTGQNLQEQIDAIGAGDTSGLATSGYVEETSGNLSNDILNTGQNLQEQIDSLELTGGGGGVGNVISVNGETGVVVISDINLEYTGVHRGSFISGNHTNPAELFTLDFESGASFYKIDLTGNQTFEVDSSINSIPTNQVRGITVRLEADSSGPYDFTFTGFPDNTFLNGQPTGINAGSVGIFSFSAFGPFSENMEAAYADNELISSTVSGGGSSFDPVGLATSGYVEDTSGVLSTDILNTGQNLQEQIDALELTGGGGGSFDPSGLATSGYVEETSGNLATDILNTGQNLQEQIDAIEISGGGGGGNVTSVNGETGIVVISDVNLEYTGVHRSSYISGEHTNPANVFTLEFETGAAYYRIPVSGSQTFEIGADISSIPINQVRGITVRIESNPSTPCDFTFTDFPENSFLNDQPTGINAGTVGIFSFNAFGPFLENLEVAYADNEPIISGDTFISNDTTQEITLVTGSASGVEISSHVSGLNSDTFSLDFVSGESFYTLDITGSQTFDTVGNLNEIPDNQTRSLTIRMLSDSTSGTHSLTFPSGYSFLGTKPTEIELDTLGICSFTIFGKEETDIVAAYTT